MPEECGSMIIDIKALQETFTRQKDRQKVDIFAYLCDNEPVSRKDITKNLHLRSTTVSNIVQELIDDGLVVEGESITQGRPGRPDFGLHFVPERLVAATIYVEKYTFIGSLVDAAGNILGQKTVAVAPHSTNNEVLKKYKELLNLLEKAIPDKSEFLGLGISAVGTVDTKNRVWVNSDRWPEIKDLNIIDIEKFAGIPVSLRRNLDNELEYLLETNPECREENTILFHWGYGIGGAYAYQGKILGSPAGRYMDIGHTVVHSKSKKKCRCGLYGCLEAEATIFGLLPSLQKRFSGLREDSEDIDKILSDPELYRVPGIIHAIEAVGISLSNLYKLFYPHRIFLVSPFAQNVKILEYLRKTISKTFYAKMQEKLYLVNLIPIHDSFAGCKRANAYPFFRKRFRELLASRF